jgi:hypothetical protein
MQQSKKKDPLDLLKKIASLCFGIAFLMAIVLFTGYGSHWVERGSARILFLAFNGLALLLNLISFRLGKHDPSFSLVYWAGTIVLFIGLLFIMMHWPYAYYVLAGGMILIAISFFIPNGAIHSSKEENDFLDEDI